MSEKQKIASCQEGPPVSGSYILTEKRFDIFQARPGFPAQDSMDRLIESQVSAGWRLAFMNDDYSIWEKETDDRDEFEHHEKIQEIIHQ